MSKTTLFLFSVILCGALEASPPPGTYELYDGSGRRTGTVISSAQASTYNDFPSLLIEVKTDLKWPHVSGEYLFSEKDTAHIQNGGLVYFQRETNDNGKKNIVTGERRDSVLFIFVKGDDKKFTTAVPFAAFDISEFEMDLPASKFKSLKKGDTLAQRVFMVETLKPVVVSRNVFDSVSFPIHRKKRAALVTTTIFGGKPTTSWFDAKTHDLLQEEGPNHLMSRSEE